MDNWDHYSSAALRMHKAIDELYEDLHNDAGNPITEEYAVSDIIGKFRHIIWLETDLIKEISIDDYDKEQEHQRGKEEEGQRD